MKGTLESPPEIRETVEARQAAVQLDALERLMTVPAPTRLIFADCLLQYQGQTRRQTWATVFSFILQCLMIGVLLLLPLYFTQDCRSRSC
jgi:hypothetical protein